MVKQDVLKVDDEIEDDDAQKNVEPEGHPHGSEDPPPPCLGELCESNGKDREQEPDRDRIDNNQGEIGEPAPPLVIQQGATGCDDLPESNEQEDSRKNGEPYVLFSQHAEAPGWRPDTRLTDGRVLP